MNRILLKENRAAKVTARNGDSHATPKVEVRVEELVIPSYLPAPPDKNPMFLEKRVHLEARLHFKEPADLRFCQGARPIAFNGDRLERSSRDVVPSTLECRRHIIGQVDSDLHGDSHFSALRRIQRRL